jgi:hypothetical protein
MSQVETTGQYRNYVDYAPQLAMSDVEVSEHALQRAIERGLSAGEIRKAIEAPRHAYYSRGHEAWIFQRGKVRLGLREHSHRPDKWVVTTFINTKEMP